MIQLLSVPEGSNITIMNAMFIRGFKINVGGFDEDKIKTQDIMTVTYKDCDTGVKYKEEIVDPEVEFYVAKSDKRCPTNRLFIEEKDAYPVVCENRHLEKTIAEITGNKEFYYGNLNTGNFSENRKLHQHPDIFYSDVNIEDRTRALFSRLYKNEPCKVSKSFLDIETDIIDLDGRFAEPGECPINSVSLLLEEQRMIYVFLLRTKRNPQIVDFEKYVNGNTIGPDLLNFLTDSVGGQEMAKKYSANNFSFKFLFFDEDKEIDLITSIFKVINHFKPDFTLAWNMGFDIPYIIERIRRLGYSPEEIMCHEDFRYKVAYYFVDEKKKSDFAERGDFANISSYTVYLDQMIQFASRRKAIRYPSYTLDSIGETIARVRKLDYKHITTDIAQLPYKDYKTFVFYNIMDVVVQYCIEFMTKDVDYVFTKCIVNNTRYSKIHRQTVYLTNRGEKIFRNEGFIMGNNCNKYNEKPTEKFAGAFVADPKQLDDTSKLKVFCRAIDVLDNMVDFDYASLYPSVIRQFFIAANTQIGRVIIDQKVHDKENRGHIERWSREGAFIEDFQSHNWLEFNCRWLNLPDFEVLYNEILNGEFFKSYIHPKNGFSKYSEDGYINAFTIRESEAKYNIVFERHDTRRMIDDNNFIPFDKNKFAEFRDHATKFVNQQF